MAEKTSEGILISDIVKEYPDMIKVIIYNDSYYLPNHVRQIMEVKKLTKASKREDSRQRSLRRSKTTVKDIMLSNRFDLWCTFTYNCRNCVPKCANNPCTCSPATCKRFDLDYTSRTLRKWFENQKRLNSPDLKYLAVPEYHKNGAIHFHCLMSGFNGRLKDSGKKTKNGQAIYNASGYYSGWTEFVKIGERFDSESFDVDYARVSAYITKYITKEMPMINGRHRYLVSKGLARPVSTVNGVAKFGLRRVIYQHRPEYITPLLEVQKFKKVAPLNPFTDPNFSLF